MATRNEWLMGWVDVGVSWMPNLPSKTRTQSNLRRADVSHRTPVTCAAYEVLSMSIPTIYRLSCRTRGTIWHRRVARTRFVESLPLASQDLPLLVWEELSLRVLATGGPPD
jgi:hypothetical protein